MAKAMQNINDIKIGDTVEVKEWGGGTCRGVVTDVLENIKRGEPGVDYTTKGGTDRWCYLNQIIAVFPVGEVA